MVPSCLTPRLRSAERTPMAGISMETGTERRSDSHHALPGPVVPAAHCEGCGACCCAAIAAPTAAAPAAMSTAPATPATRARGLPGLGGVRGGGVRRPAGGGAEPRVGGGVGRRPGGVAGGRGGGGGRRRGRGRRGAPGGRTGGPAGRRSGGSAGRRSRLALRPGHDHTKPGYAPPVRVLQCPLLAFLKEFYPRSLEITVMKKPLSACSVRWAYFYGRGRFLRTVLSCAALAFLPTRRVPPGPGARTGGAQS